MTTDAEMATTQYQPNLSACNRALDEKIRRRTYGLMNIRRYKVLKLLLAFAVLLATVFGIAEGGDPTVLLGITIPSVLLLAGFEVAEIIETYQAGRDVQQSSGESDS